MRQLRLSILILCTVLNTVLGVVPAGAALQAVEIDERLEQADLLVRLGVLEKGAGRSFEEAAQLLETVEKELREADLSVADRQRLTQELDAVHGDLELLKDLYEERFFGMFPLARLISPTILADEGLAISEQLFHPPDVAAVLITTRKLLKQLERYDHPHIVIRSSPNDRRLEIIAAETLLRDGRSTPHMRRTLVNGLDADELVAFDRGEITPSMIDKLSSIFNAVNLLMISVTQPTAIEDGSVIYLQGDMFTPGEVVRGSAVDASPNIRVENFSYLGFALDRRDQYWPIICIQLLLLTLAMVWSTRTRWSLGKSLTRFYRIAIGAALFVFGRTFLALAVVILGKFSPEATAMVAAAWWWPALMGLLAIIAGGLAAWLIQARLTDIVPGARGERAVGSIFALVTLGACSFFVTPLLLLDETRGLFNLLPFVVSSVALAFLFGFAVRTGPPVPSYFAIGPLLVAPVVGACVFSASPGMLWVATMLTSFLWLAVWISHGRAPAHGTRESQLSEDEAALADQQRLLRISKKLRK